MTQLVFIFSTFFTSIALAAGGDHEGIPTVVWFQFLNLGALLALLGFLLKGHIVNLFNQRHEDFHQAIRKAEIAKKEAEEKHNEVHERLTKLEDSTQDSLQKAESEAKELKSRIIKEAKELSQKLEEDAQKTVQVEIARAKEDLRIHVLSESIHSARKLLDEKMEDSEHKRLSKEFVEKIQVVQR